MYGELQESQEATGILVGGAQGGDSDMTALFKGCPGTGVSFHSMLSYLTLLLGPHSCILLCPLLSRAKEPVAYKRKPKNGWQDGFHLELLHTSRVNEDQTTSQTIPKGLHVTPQYRHQPLGSRKAEAAPAGSMAAPPSQ